MRPVSEVLLQAVYKLMYYPAVMICCFIINTALILLFAVGEHISNPKENEALGILSVALPTAQGFITAVIFFAQNKVVRECYMYLCCPGWVATRTEIENNDDVRNMQVNIDTLSPLRSSSFIADPYSDSYHSSDIVTPVGYELELAFGRESRQAALQYPRESLASVCT